MRPQPPVSETDPCWKERQLMLKCLDDNAYDKTKCEAFIKNGKFCKFFWSNISSERTRKGIYPAIPVGEERERVKQEYLKDYKKPTIRVQLND